MRISQRTRRNLIGAGVITGTLAITSGIMWFSGKSNSTPSTADPGRVGMVTGAKQPGVDRQWVIEFLNKVKREILLANRYDGLLAAAIDLVKSGRVGVDFTTPRSGQEDVGNEYFPKSDKLEVYFSDRVFKDESVRANFEGSLLHEMGHAVQDLHVAEMPRGVSEAESHLLEADYRSHAYPSRVSDSWITIGSALRESSIYAINFNVPNRIVTEVQPLGEDSPEYRRALNDIAEQYLAAEMFLFALHSQTAREWEDGFYQMVQQGAEGGRFDATQEVQKTIDSFRNSDQQHIAFEVENDSIYYNYSAPFGKYLAVCRIILTTSWQKNGQRSAQKKLDEMYELFRMKALPSGSRAFKFTNKNRVFDGIGEGREK